MNIHTRIRYLREINGLMQTDIAKLLHVTQRAYSNYENGHRQMPYELLIKLSIFYDTSIDYLLNLTNDYAPYKRSEHYSDFENEIQPFSDQLKANNDKYRFNQKIYGKQ